MDITEVRIKLMEDAGERLQAFCSITFDDAFVVRDLKIIEGTKGSFVAMPSRKLTDHCPKCGCKNHLRAGYCSQCGNRLGEDRAPKDSDGRAKLHADIAHPINSACREMIQKRVLEAYQEELERSRRPGYVSSYEDFDVGDGYVAAKTDRTASPDEAPSYTSVIQRLESGSEEQRQPHHLRRSDAPAQRPASGAASHEADGEFGAGIL